MRSIVKICLFTFLYICLQSMVFSASMVSHKGVHAKLFYSTSEKFDVYELITGKVVYQEEDKDNFSQGFRAESVENIEGMLLRAVYDYPATTSSLGIYRALLDSLDKNGFDSVFTCSGAACGDMLGWELLFGKYVLGKEEKQHYAAYRKPINNGQTVYIAAYINEADSKPRMIFDKISPVSTNSFVLNLEFSRNTGKLSRKIQGTRLAHGAILFPSRSVEPASDISGKLAFMADDILSNSSHKYMIVGYTDSSGSKESNRILSRKRAAYIRDLLIRKYGIPKHRLDIYGAGESQPVAENTTSKGRALNRRVEVFRSAQAR